MMLKREEVWVYNKISWNTFQSRITIGLLKFFFCFKNDEFFFHSSLVLACMYVPFQFDSFVLSIEASLTLKLLIVRCKRYFFLYFSFFLTQVMHYAQKLLFCELLVRILIILWPYQICFVLLLFIIVRYFSERFWPHHVYMCMIEYDHEIMKNI